MKQIVSVMAVFAMLSFFTVADTLAQRGGGWRGGGGWGPGTPYSRMYNPQTLETLSGEVVSVDEFTPIRGMHSGLHAVVKTDKETISVHLGPGWYLENQDVTIDAKDKIEVKGSRVTYEGKPALIAAEIKKGNQVLTLRDASGVPAWSGWRRR